MHIMKVDMLEDVGLELTLEEPMSLEEVGWDLTLEEQLCLEEVGLDRLCLKKAVDLDWLSLEKIGEIAMLKLLRK